MPRRTAIASAGARRVVPAVVLAAAVLGTLLIATPAAAQWKWLDQKRQIQYSDLPPPAGIPEHDILQRPGGAQRRAAVTAAAPPVSAASAASGAPALVPKTVEPELEAKRRKAEQDEAAKDAAKKATEAERQAVAKAANCNLAKAQMRTLDSGIRVARVNPSGEREILGDEARADEVRRTREVISADCK